MEEGWQATGSGRGRRAGKHMQTKRAQRTREQEAWRRARWRLRHQPNMSAAPLSGWYELHTVFGGQPRQLVGLFEHSLTDRLQHTKDIIHIPEVSHLEYRGIRRIL